MRAMLALTLVVVAAGAAVARAAQRPDGAPATCAHQSSAPFPGTAGDLVLGPLVLVGGRVDPGPDVVARVGGQKYPLLVLAGHRVTVEVVGDGATLRYGDRRTRGAGHRSVTFSACPRDRASSTYRGRRATFWSGFVLTARPRCVRLRVWVDDERRPRTARLPLGRRCPR